MAQFLSRAADLTVTKDDFYEYFKSWMADNPGDLTYVIVEEVDLFWAFSDERKFLGLRIFGAPKNIQEAWKQKLRILARALEEGWTAERAQNEVYEA